MRLGTPMFSSNPSRPSRSKAADEAVTGAPSMAVVRMEVMPQGAARHVPPSVERTSPTQAPALDPASLAHAIRDAALALGFARVGFCPVEPFENGARALDRWLAEGHHGEMTFMSGASRADPRALLPEAQTLIVVALAYERARAEPTPRGSGIVPTTALVARYALGKDYHLVLKERLRRLADRCAELSGRPVLARPCVDTAPLLEREAARRAGVGFTAKNTMSIAPGLGSYVLLGELLLDLELAPTEPIAPGCGSCRACLDACPTSAFVDAYTLDARRCISYLTIEHAGAIPRELRPSIGRWVFGCDICQEVCPHNRSPKPRPADAALAPRPGTSNLDLCALLSLGSAAHRRLVRRTALARASRIRLQRNAAVALGNTGEPSVVPALATALTQNPSALVRAHCAWALGRIGTDAARLALRQARGAETDSSVIEEIDIANNQLSCDDESSP
jgi:epoxyqueuosine reductase